MSNNMKIMGRSRNNKFKTLVTSGIEGSMRLDGIRKKTPMISLVQKKYLRKLQICMKEKER